MKAIQLFMLTASLLMTFTLFIGAFFNPSYWLFVPGMTYLSYLFSKKSDGKGYLHYRSGRGARLRWV